MKFSIVVPYYNSSKFVKETLASIYNQNYNSFETLIIDDGSNENEKEKLNEINELFNFKIVTHSNNKGLGEARNTGISHSCGEYIIFLDSDDYFCYNNILNKLNGFLIENDGVDIIKTNTKILDQTNPNKQAVYNEISNILFEKEKSDKELYYKALSSWQFVYKKSFLEYYDIKFKLPRFEDRPFFYEAILKARSIINYDYIMTVYRKRSFGVDSSILQKKRTVEDLHLYLSNCKYTNDILKDADINLKKYVFTNSFCTLFDSYDHLINFDDNNLTNEVKNVLGNEFSTFDKSSPIFQLYGEKKYYDRLNKLYGE